MTTAIALQTEAREGTRLIDYIREMRGDDQYMPVLLLNVDVPCGTIKCHQEKCTYVQKAEAKKWKRIGAMGRDGGWMVFTNQEDAMNWIAENKPNYKLGVAGCCKK